MLGLVIHVHQHRIGLQGHTANLSVMSLLISMWRLSKSSMFAGLSFVIPIIIHNSTGKIYRAFLLQLQCQRRWVSTHLPHALDKSPDTAILPTYRSRKENWILVKAGILTERCAI